MLRPRRPKRQTIFTSVSQKSARIAPVRARIATIRPLIARDPRPDSPGPTPDGHDPASDCSHPSPVCSDPSSDSSGPAPDFPCPSRDAPCPSPDCHDSGSDSTDPRALPAPSTAGSPLFRVSYPHFAHFRAPVPISFLCFSSSNRPGAAAPPPMRGLLFGTPGVS